VGVTQQVAAHGHGGVGKTSLALEFAWRAWEGGDFPGGVFWLRGDAPDPAVELAKLAVPLGLALRDRPDETAALVRHALTSGPPSLLVLDNVDSADDWRRMLKSGVLPSGACRRLVTTRRLQLAGVAMYPIERLTTDDGVMLLAEFRGDAALPANRSAVEFVVDQWFDGWAIGLTVVGAYMQAVPNVTWDELAQMLQRKGVGAVRAVEQWVDEHAARQDMYEARIDAIFSDLWQTLDPWQRRALEYAAIFPQDQLVRHWLIALLGRDPDLELDDSLPGGRAAYAERTVQSLEAMKLFRVAGIVPLEPTTVPAAPDASKETAVVDLASTIRDPETCVAKTVQVKADAQPVPEVLELLGFHRALRRLVRELGAESGNKPNRLKEVAAFALERADSCSDAIVNKPSRAELGPLAALASELIESGELTLGARLLTRVSDPLRLLARAAELDLPFRRLVNSPGFEELAPDLRGESLNDYALALSHLGGRENLEAARGRMEEAIAIELQHFDASIPRLPGATKTWDMFC
jgi:hypothetical protein